VVASNPLTLSIPFGALAFALADVDTDNLVVMYRWMTLKDGEPSYEVGVIPGDKVTRGQNKVSFQTTKFGTFQVGISETKITKPLLAATEEPPALKSCERYAAAAFPTCTQDGQVGCVTTASFKAADSTKLIPQNIRSGIMIADVNGDLIASPADCSLNGQQSCVANGSFFAGKHCPVDGSNCFVPQFAYPAAQTMKAIDTSTIDSSKMLQSLTIAGVTGSIAEKTLDVSSTSMPSPGYFNEIINLPSSTQLLNGVTVLGVNGTATTGFSNDCSANGQVSCVTTNTFKAFDFAELVSGNIKKDVIIGGVRGEYPSSSYPLPNSAGADLTSATFNTQLKSNAVFQYFGSDGTRYTGTGSPIDPWDLRIGKNFAGVDGKLKSSCRNRAFSPSVRTLSGSITISPPSSPVLISASNHGLYNGNQVNITFSNTTIGLNSGAYFVINANPSSFQISNSDTSSTAISAYASTSTTLTATISSAFRPTTSYDNLVTTDDQNGWTSTFPNNRILTWPDATDCFGVDTMATGDEENIWKDVTTSNGTAPSTCSATQANCTIQDKMTNLWWSKSFSINKWDNAWQICMDSTHNFKTDWRLPTQKELLEAYTHSIRSVTTHSTTFSNNWISDTMLAQAFWSGTSVSFSTFDNAAWVVSLGKGDSFPNDKNSYQNVVCVR
jgi:hypothetical protein